jgi:hypothetical protein
MVWGRPSSGGRPQTIGHEAWPVSWVKNHSLVLHTITILNANDGQNLVQHDASLMLQFHQPRHWDQPENDAILMG